MNITLDQALDSMSVLNAWVRNLELLEMNQPDPPRLPDVLRAISKRPDEHCKAAWDYLDIVAPGDFMDLLTKLVQSGRSGPFLYRHAAKAFKKNDDPRFSELIALAIECAVRRENTR